MPKLIQNIGAVICGSGRHSPPNRQFVTIGNQVFAVAHSREEMARIMRMHDRQVAGYVLQHRM
jgi:hypothetical protein